MSIKRVSPSPQLETFLMAARKVADALNLRVLILLSEIPYDFSKIQNELRKLKLIVASDRPEILQAAKDDGVDLITLLHEPETRQNQLGQALLEAIADELISSGETIVALYVGFDRNDVDTLSIISLNEQLSRLTARDLQRLETQVPLETLRLVVDLACDIRRRTRRESRGNLVCGGKPSQGAANVSRTGSRPLSRIQPQGLQAAESPRARKCQGTGPD
ncbi:MAG: hypothetical protein R3C12_19415 [Planctomycetaceae bacterium]